MQLDHVLKKLNLDLLTPPPGSGGGVKGGLQAKYLRPRCCILNSLLFDMQYAIILKKWNFDFLASRVRGRGLRAKYLLP